jgi:hypothetical protein
VVGVAGHSIGLTTIRLRTAANSLSMSGRRTAGIRGCGSAASPVIETVRGLLAGSTIAATTVWTAVAWCLALTVLGWLWARAAYRRPRA